MKLKKKHIILISLLSIVAIFFSVTGLVAANYNSKFFPNTQIAGLNVSGSTKDQAKVYLKERIKAPEKIKLFTTYNQEPINYEVKLADINFSYSINETVDKAFADDHTGNLILTIQNFTKSLREDRNHNLQYNYNKVALEEYLSVIAEEITDEAVNPSVNLEKGIINVHKGQAGKTLDSEAIIADIEKQFANNSFDNVAITPIEIDPTISDEKALEVKEKAEKYLNKSITLKFEYENIVLDDDELVQMVGINSTYNDEFIKSKVSLISDDLNREAQNPVFVFENNKVKEFSPAKDGIEVDENKLYDLIVAQLNDLAKEETTIASIEVPTNNTPPDFDTEEINDLGIKELIGRGTSKFRGSISSRIHNVALATSRLDGVIIKPGEVFSFNEALGDVSSYTGYKAAYVIMDGKTVLGDGGGVCQVSTTFFRAALDAGLPIVERRSHSYRVGYYEQDNPPGLDATVYAPYTDLKVKNDTPAHILIQAKADTSNLTMYFELYGTSDGRKVELTKPVIYESSPAPETVYVDDPTLPSGQTKQIEYAAGGAKSRFDYLVTRNGETLIEKTFYSSYRPWAAVYLRGTGPAQ